ncbi:MAG: hypothetical protein KC621_32310 [Myxococcales bacterium]|nr:hypothetical protein [Myxococcales bacterium]
MLVFIAQTALAADFHVGVGQPYATIQAAVTASADGDRIVIHAGTYVEAVDTTKILDFVGAAGGGAVWTPPANARALSAHNGGSIDGLHFVSDHYHDCAMIEGPPGVVVEVSNAVFENCRDGMRAEADVDLVVTNSLFRDSVWGIVGSSSGEVIVRDSGFLRNYVAASTDSHVAELSGCDFRYNDAGFFGEIKDAAVIERNYFCGNDGGALNFELRTTNGAPDTWIRDNVFVDNVNTNSYGAGGLDITAYSCADFNIHILNNTFAGNGGAYAAHAFVPTTGTDLWNNGFGRGRNRAPGIKAGNYIFACPVTTRGDYNLFFRNDGGHLDNLTPAQLGPNTLWGVPPMVTSYTRNQICDDDLSPLPGSPLIDGGDPASPTDPDGSRADIGSRYP